MVNLLKGDILVKAKLAVIVTAVLLLVGCSAISSGTITKKNHYEAYDYPVRYCVMYKSDMTCRYYGTRYEHVPERWSFDIQNDNQDTGWVDVSASEFEKYQVGDYYGEKR